MSRKCTFSRPVIGRNKLGTPVNIAWWVVVLRWHSMHPGESQATCAKSVSRWKRFSPHIWSDALKMGLMEKVRVGRTFKWYLTPMGNYVLGEAWDKLVREGY